MLEAVRRRGLPAVAFVHDDWLDYGRYVDAWLRALRRPRRSAAPLAERLVGIPPRVDFDGGGRATCSSASTPAGTRRGRGRRLRAHGVAHSGIDPDFLDPAPERAWRWRLLYVGRLDPRKGVDTAVEALAAPARRGAARRSSAAGTTREEARLRALAEELGVAERVALRRPARPRRAARRLRAAPTSSSSRSAGRSRGASCRSRRWRAAGRSSRPGAAARASTCATARTACCSRPTTPTRSPPRCGGSPATRRCARGCASTASQTAARHTEPVFNAAVERGLLSAQPPPGRRPAGRAGARPRPRAGAAPRLP